MKTYDREIMLIKAQNPFSFSNMYFKHLSIFNTLKFLQQKKICQAVFVQCDAFFLYALYIVAFLILNSCNVFFPSNHSHKEAIILVTSCPLGQDQV